MKVVFVSNDFRVYWKGRLIYLHEYLAGKNIQLQVIELFGIDSAYSFDDYNNSFQWWECLFPDKGVAELTNQEITSSLFLKLDQAQPDIIIASPITFFAGALSLRWAKLNRKKLIMFDDAKPLIQFKRNFVVRSIRDLLTQQIDGFWLPSNDYDTAYPALDKKKILFFYGYSCINNNLFKVSQKKEFTHQSIICVARLVPVKNLDNLLKAWQLVEKENAKYKLVIVGDGSAYDSLNNLANDLNLTQVQFVGTISNDQLPEFYFNADAFILPSLSETWGLVVNEAMAAGLPILLSNKINATHTLLKEGINGFSFDPYDVEAMADAILNYINLDMQAKENMSAQSLKIIAEMDYVNMGTQLVEALNKISNQKFKRANTLAMAIINLWNGNHNTAGWDTLDSLAI